MNTKPEFGNFLREQRMLRYAKDPSFSVRGFAKKVNVQPSFISKVERGDVGPPSEATIIRIADALEEDRDVMLALAGKVSEDLRQAIVARPLQFGALIRQLNNASEKKLSHVLKEASASYNNMD